MSEDLKNRKRNVNVNNMAREDVDTVSFELGKKIGSICDKYIALAEKEVNNLAEIYGVKAKMQIVFIDQKTGETITP